jgi:hypothetical protein
VDRQSATDLVGEGLLLGGRFELLVGLEPRRDLAVIVLQEPDGVGGLRVGLAGGRMTVLGAAVSSLRRNTGRPVTRTPAA